MPGQDAFSKALAGLAAVLGVVLVAVSLLWVLDIPAKFGVALFDEQPLALALGLALALTALTICGSGIPQMAIGLIVGVTLLGMMALIAWRFPQLQVMAMMRPLWLIVVAMTVIAGLMFLVWRTLGIAIVVIIMIFSALAMWGAALGLPTTQPDRWAIYMLVDANSILGLPLRVAVQIVIPFVLFGELLRLSGGGEYMTRLSLAAFGRYRGGSAKAAVGASALFGTISGNAVSNVAGTGIVTIPLMVRTGMKPPVAGALEAAASTGGQLLPPVMGAAAFVMADFLRIPYLEVATAAALPAILYFTALMMQVDRLAARDGIKGMERADMPPLRGVLAEGAHFAIPFLVMFAVLFTSQTRPELAALAALACLAIVATFRSYEGKRLRPADLIEALVQTGKAAAPLLLITAAAGMIIGLVSLTGLGFSVASDAIKASGGNTFLLLLLVAVISIVFGMGMPTVAVYVVLATLLAPALMEVGLNGLQAHLFILYFGMMSMLTPPVALASITAARIAGAGIWRTSFCAVGMAWVAYVIPILFAFSPALLLQGDTFHVTIAALTAIMGTASISIGAVGFLAEPLSPLWRAGFCLAGAALLLPAPLGTWAAAANAVGFVLMATLLFIRLPLVTKRKTTRNQ
ncbi:TRAP transporter permease [Roseovarius sp. S4756]|uniref:TRAP transporter permease n=1 Tax=Roseovarius maritimus TaxID=3342637 RepID=UPI00372C044B